MKIKDLDFEKFISEEEIKQKITSIAETIDDHYKWKNSCFPSNSQRLLYVQRRLIEANFHTL